MKEATPLDPSVERFREVLLAALADSPLRSSEISKRAGIHRCQGHHICRGRFKRISTNVLKVARVLGIAEEAVGAPARRDVHWGRIEEKVQSIWDGTALGADRLIAVLEMISIQGDQSPERPTLRLVG